MRNLLLILIGVISFVAQANAQEEMRSVQINPVLPALSSKAARLKNLPANAVVAVEVSADNPLQVFLLSQADYEKFPLVATPLFQGDVLDKLTFTIQVPTTGNYYLVLDNSKNIQSTEVSAKISAGRGSTDLSIDNGRKDITTDSLAPGIQLSKLNEELAKIFIFDPFPITQEKCGSENAYSSKNSVVLCQEYIARIQNVLNDKEKTSEVLLFVIFHEIGHVLLYQWEYPFFDNESIADEFATVLLVMVGQKEKLRATAKYFASNTTGAELLGKAFVDDRHPLSIQRARNIVNWVNDPKRIEHWQTIFIPHLQTSVLQRWQQEGKVDSLLKLIEEELGRRNNAAKEGS